MHDELHELICTKQDVNHISYRIEIYDGWFINTCIPFQSNKVNCLHFSVEPRGVFKDYLL